MKASEAHLYIYKLVQTACTAVVINVFSFCIDFYIILMFCLLVSIYIIFSTLVIATIFGQLQYNEILTFFNLCKGNEITWFEILEKIDQGSQIGQIWRILCQNCSDDSTEVI